MFAVGDVVRLKSGGPAMTVVLVGSNDGVPEVICVWFAGSKTEQGTFPAAAVEATTPP
jgi:uncharacterized protein YodC (DUF2158 family)